MPFRIYHNDKLIAEFEDRVMEPYMKEWETQYVSGELNLETETLKIWIENKRRKKNKIN